MPSLLVRSSPPTHPPRCSLAKVLALALPALALVAAAGCDAGPCDDSNGFVCALPWPSDRYLAEDSATETGYRLAYDYRALPTNALGKAIDVAPYERLDGMSPASQLMTVLVPSPDLDASGAARQESIARSLEASSPTVILDLESGVRIPHWTELDVQADSDATRVLYLRPAVRLLENRSYGVAIRDLVDSSGNPVPAPDGFAQLRDKASLSSADLRNRQAAYEHLFSALEASGLDRTELQSGWQFHTASGDAIRGDLMAMRADALARLGPDGLGCTITYSESNRGGQIWRYVEGTFTAPLYMTSQNPPALLVRDADGKPVFQGMVQVPFIANLPATLADAPGGAVAGPLVAFGHGLLGNAKSYVDSPSLRDVANRFGVVVAGTDWAGMSTSDLGALAGILIDASQFPYMTERLQQGMIWQIALTRDLAGGCRTLPELTAGGTPLIDPSRRYYAGGSQGGIFGATVTALSPDIERGALFVNGSSFGLMLDRSIAFAPYFEILKLAYPRRIDRAQILPMAQHLWDSTDPASYLPFLADGLPGGSGPKQIVSIVAENDAQVPPLAGDLAARTAGLTTIRGSAREPWGVPVADAPFAGSAFVSMDWGDRGVPYGNVPPAHDDGGHGSVPFTDASLTIAQHFLETGVVTMPCSGVCDPG
jgi:hypothetical protein